MARKFTFEIVESTIDLRVAEFTAHEWISGPYIVNLKLASRAEIDFNAVIAKEALLTIWGNDQSEERYFHGIIKKFIKTGSEAHFFFYEAVMVPDLWRLSLMQDCRIFQGLPVLKKNESDPSETPIVEQILKDANITSDRYDIRTQETYDKRDYCAQYRETDFNFISRLLEEEGIFYFFEHSNDKHLLVFGDSTVSYKTIPGKNNEVEFHPADAMVSEEDFVYNFKLSQEIHSGKVSLRDFDFLSPSNFPNDNKEDSYKNLEIYDYPGGYIKNETENEVDKATVKKGLAEIRLQEAAICAERAEGESVCPRFAPGHTFTLTKHDEFTTDPEYVLIEVIHTGNQPQVFEERSGHRDKGFSYTNSFIGIPSTTQFRPQRKTPKAFVRGPQTAIIVDSEGRTDYNFEDPQAPENVYTDGYGRVKARFHWERSHKVGKDDKWHNTAWVRVSQAWAGQGWGSMHIPHVGQEVIVDFLEGDPDRPIITGRVYNGLNEPHADMKPLDHLHVSGIRDEYGNRMIFNSTLGEEEIRLYSPNQNSFLELGKEGAGLSTDYNQWKRVVGDIIDLGFGLKMEGFVGAEFSGKLGSSAELTVGSALEAFLGNKIDISVGTVIEHKWEKEIKETDDDIDNSSKKDHILSAGDGISIVGGTRKQNNDDTHNAIMNAYGKGLTLSFGEYEKPEIGLKAWTTLASWKDWLKKDWRERLSIALVLTGAVFNSIIASASKPFQVDTDDYDVDKWNWWVHTGISSTTGIFTLIYTLISIPLIRYCILSDEKIEPKYHEEPDSIIGLDEHGITLGVNYKKYQGPAPQDVAEAVAGGEEWKSALENVLNPESEKGVMDSKIMLNKDGSIMINSNGDSKEIELTVGDKEDPHAYIAMTENLAGMESGVSSVIVNKAGGINLKTDTHDITLDPGEAMVDISGSKVKILGSEFTKAQIKIGRDLTVG